MIFKSATAQGDRRTARQS